jgi:tetratricopeptide (TPR) repeat protein
MDKSRLDFLREAVASNPHDPFARYGLAMELAKGAPHEAWEHFSFLLDHHPDYSATYYQAGMFLSGQGKREDARRILAKGIEVTRQQGKKHALSELQAAYDEISDEL